MPSTPFRDTGARLHLSGWTFTIEGRVNYNNPTRRDNTVTFTGVSATARYGGTGNSFTWAAGWDIQAMVTSNNARSHGHWTGSRSVGSTNTTGTQSFSFNVAASATSINVRTQGRFRNDGWSNSGENSISIPALGSPSGNTSIQGTPTINSITVRNSVTNWGANATGSSIRSYRATSSNFSGQTYLAAGANNSNTTHSGLTPNTRYWFRGWAQNGGGNTSYLSTVDATTLSSVYDGGTQEILATTTKWTGVRVYQGRFTTSSKVQYRVKGTTAWRDSPTVTGDNITLEITGLLPNTTYERRFVATTTAGTTTNGVFEFTTLPAGKLVYPDGTVRNAIPRLVRPEGGTAEMVNINLVDPS